MKVLIVEDEYVSRRKLEKILSPYFICQSATTANDALNLYLTSIQKRSPFKLIFLDIVLPDESGVELLQKIRNKETELGIDENKRSKIIMTTSKSDINTVKTCIQFGCNDYIVKPFDKKKVLEKIKHYIPTNKKSISREKENIIDYVIKRLKKGELFTIGFSNVWLAVKDAISKDIHISTVAEIIKQDPVVTYKIIQISNSPIYRPVKKITSLEDALSRIGLEESLNIIHNVFMKNMIFSKENIFDDFLERYFKHSVAVANLCEIICEHLSIKTDEDPYLLGLFHDIGKLVFITAVDEVIKQKDIKGELTIQDIQLHMQSIHSELGVALLSAHGFSYTFLKVAKFHNNLKGCSNITNDLLVVSLANEIAKHKGYNISLSEPEKLENHPSYKLLKLKSHIGVIEKRFAKALEKEIIF